MGLSHTLLTSINCTTLCISFPFLILGFIIKHGANSPCDPVMYKPLLAVGAALFIVSLLGMFGGCCGITLVLWFYAVALFIVVAGLLGSLIISGVVLKEGGTRDGGNSGLQENHLGGLCRWLRKKIVGSKEWDEIRECMSKQHVCNKMNGIRSILDFLSSKKSKLSSIEMGCCRPPEYCGFEYEKDKTWKVPEKGLSSLEKDCKAWDNDKNKLCYGCDSCKAGYFDLFLKELKKIIILNAVLLLLVLLVFIIALCAIC